MNNWRDTILSDFIPNVSKLTLVADPDDLLTEEKLALELRNRGFDLIEFHDAVEFRYAYETKYRSIWDQGEHTDLVVILRLDNAELESLPYDLLQAGRKLAFNLGAIFPNLSYPVIEKIDRSLLDILFIAQTKSPPDRLGDNATKDFILRHVFGIAPELIATDVDLLRSLLRLHYNDTQLPHILSERFVSVLREHGSFSGWPLENIVPDNKAFFLFLQERWPLFLKKLKEKDTLNYGLRETGPDDIPFDHQDIRVYIDNLFVEGKLSPIEAKDIAVDKNSWVRSGVIENKEEDGKVRASRLFEIIGYKIPTVDSRYSDWISFAFKWAELSALVYNENDNAAKSRLEEIGNEINVSFAEWLDSHYSSLINLPPSNPTMVHHIPRRLARDLEGSPGSRVALIVVDGLALDQWVTLRQIVQEQDTSLVMRESAVFAWIPTITSVSRQAIFSGKTPLYFPSSINNTNNEGNLWKQFWEDNGLSRLDIAYQRSLGDGDATKVLESIAHLGATKAIGLVVDKVDKIMHGMQLGTAGMHNQIKQWGVDGFLTGLVGSLLDHKYEVWLTADHGNIECYGKGRPSEGVLAETRGERVRVYPSSELRSKVSKNFDFAYEWQPTGLPPGYFPLVAGGKDAFISPKDTIVGHGGIAMEEVIVPLVKFERRSR